MSVIPKGNATATIEAANDYTNFLISDQGQALIADYGKEQYGKGLFNPMTPEKAKEFKVDSTTPATATRPVLVYAAGSLASPFAKLKKTFDANNPGSELGVYTGASVTMIEKVTKAGQKADAVASADAYLIPKLMYPEQRELDALVREERGGDRVQQHDLRLRNGDHGRQLVRYPRPTERRAMRSRTRPPTPAAIARSC